MERKELLYGIDGSVNWYSHYRNGIEVPKVKPELPYDPAIPLWASILRKENTNSDRYMHPLVHCSVIYYRWDMEAACVPIDRDIGKGDVVYTHKREYCSAVRKGHERVIPNNTGGAIEYYAKWSKSAERQMPPDFTYMGKLKNKASRWNRLREQRANSVLLFQDGEREEMDEAGEEDWEVQTFSHK